MVVNYTYALNTLNDYGCLRLNVAKITKKNKSIQLYQNAMYEIDMLRNNSKIQHSSAMKKTISSKAALNKSIRLLIGKNYIPVWRRKSPYYSISLPKTKASGMGSTLRPSFSCGL